MKIGILTFHASHNYGSMLQAYALQTVLGKLGHESEIINFRSDVQKGLIPPPVKLKHPRSSLIKFIKQPVKTFQLLQKYNKFENFIKKDLKVSRELKDHGEVERYVNECGFDAIITGSDQIWNPFCWDFDMTYLLNFRFEGKRIAYAPSFGSFPQNIKEKNLNKISKAISRYDFLSSREERGSQLIKSLTGKEAKVVLDPTFLLDRSDYAKLTDSKFKSQEPYILYYTPREQQGYFEYALNLSKKLGFKIIVTDDNPQYIGDNVEFKLNTGPREFLSILEGAEYCIGNSFHLMVFSLIFNKEFLIISPKEDSRIVNILKSLDLLDRIISNKERINIPTAIDKVISGENREREILNSYNYLQNCFSSI